jgi:hypothetical protein
MRRSWLDHRSPHGVRSHTVFLAASGAAVVVSLLAGLGVVGGPELLLVALAFYSLFILPGLIVSGLLFGASLTLLETICAVFAMGLCFSSIVVCLGFIPGVSYRLISIVEACLTVGLLVIAGRRSAAPLGSEGNARRAMRGFGVIAGEKGGAAGEIGGTGASGGPGIRTGIIAAALFALCFLVLRGTGALGWRTDALDHVSYVRRSVESNVLFPSDSFFRDGDGAGFDVRKGLWHPVLSLWTYQSHAAADRVWKEVPAFCGFFALCGFGLLAFELCGSTACAAVSLLFFLLFYQGEGGVWLTKIGFSRNMSLALLWIDIAFLISYYRLRESRYLVAAFLMSAVGAGYHVVFILLLGAVLLSLFLYVTFAPGGKTWRLRFWGSIPVLVAALAISLVARARALVASYDVIHTHRQGMLVLSPTLAVVDPAVIVAGIGVVFFFALLTLPFFFLVASRHARRGLVFVMFLVPVILVLDPITASLMEQRLGYLHYRLLEAAPLMVLLSLVVTGLAGIVLFGGRPGQSRAIGRTGTWGWKYPGRIAAAAVLVVFAYLPLRDAVIRLRDEVRAIGRTERTMANRYAPVMRALRARIPEHSVIVSDPVTSYVISAFTDDFVVVTLDQHGSPADTSALDRLREVRDFMSPAVPLIDSRAWLERSGAEYVLVDTGGPREPGFFSVVPPGSAALICEKFATCPELTSETFDLGGFRLFEIDRRSLDRPLETACAEPLATALPCEGNDHAETSEGSGGGGGSPLAGEVSGSGGASSEWANDERLVVDSGVDVGCGVVLSRLVIDRYELQRGDTLRGRFCWKVPRALTFGFPLETVVRIETEFPRGHRYRQWYSKQYRRFIERRHSRFYRFTWSERLMSGDTYPDQWQPDRAVGQDFSFPISRWMTPGTYEVRIKVVRLSYLPNRVLADYLSNDDSLEGIVVAEVTIEDSSR